MEDQADKARAVVRAHEQWLDAKASGDAAQKIKAARVCEAARDERVRGVWDWIAGRT